MTRALLLLLLFSARALAAPGGEVTLPLGQLSVMLDQIDAAAEPSAPPAGVLHVERRVEGVFQRGVFTGSLVVDFELLSAGPATRVPVLDSAASAAEVRLDGRETSLLSEGGMYTIGVTEPGRHRVELRFFQGQEDDRFARKLSLSLPPSGPTRIEILIPEPDIEARLAAGALTETRREGQSTRLVGQLDASGQLDLSWQRALSHAEDAGEARVEATLNGLFTLHEALVKGRAVFEFDVIEGELDRIDLDLPEGIEVVDVTGEDVLQWHSEPEGVAVLMRYLVDSQTRFDVHFQFPVDLEQELPLRMPLPRGDVPLDGAAGVEGPAGLQVEIAKLERARELTLRDLPPALAALTDSPLLMGFRFSEPPEMALSVTRHHEVELTSTVVDDIQASTVLIEDGSEITKVRLRLRNNTRQYLGLTLPEGATLTQSLIDGWPVRPAKGAEGRLLLPLRQSERLRPGEVELHEVRAGDTLSGLATAYFNDSNAWESIIATNPGILSGEMDLEVGQVLRIAPIGGAAIQERSFVIELSFERRVGAMGGIGRRQVLLPALDVDAVEVTWHLYVPRSLAPVAFDSNLSQYSSIRYDPVRRLRQFIGRARWIRWAWARSTQAGDGYSSILNKRKAIYRAESRRGMGGQEVVGSFPLVGQRYRFKRILLGRDVPQVAVTWLRADAISPIRWAAFVASFGLAWGIVGVAAPPRRRWLVAAAGLGGLLIVAHYVLGVHRRVLWGLDAALFTSLARDHGARWWVGAKARLARPRSLLDWLAWRNLLALFGLWVVMEFALARPLFLSSAALVVLLVARGRTR